MVSKQPFSVTADELKIEYQVGDSPDILPTDTPINVYFTKEIEDT